VKLKSKTLGTSLISGTQLTHKEVVKPNHPHTLSLLQQSLGFLPQLFFKKIKKIKKINKNKKIKLKKNKKKKK